MWLKLHDEASPPSPACKLYTCSEFGCGKSFKYPSKLSKHEKTHVKLDRVEVKCCETGCLKYFSNKECLRAHIKSCHQYTKCPDCGTQQLKKIFKRHQRIHQEETGTIEIPCSFDGCHHSFSNRSNLNVHIKAVHLEEKPYACQDVGKGIHLSKSGIIMRKVAFTSMFLVTLWSLICYSDRDQKVDGRESVRVWTCC